MLLEFQPRSIIGQIYRAVYKHDLVLLLSASAKYQAETYTAQEIARHKKCFARLFVKAALEHKNEVGIVLLGLGVDLNGYGNFALTKDRSPYFASVQLPKYSVDAFPYLFPSHVLPFVECYLLDVIIFADNFALLEQIGLDKFDLDIYKVGPYQFQNILNPKVNPSKYNINNSYPNPKARLDAKSKFKHDLVIRLLWCSMFCHFLSKHHQYDWMRKLHNHSQKQANTLASSFRNQVLRLVCQDRAYETFCCKPYDTAKITTAYLNADLSNSLSSKWLQRQLWCDTWLNFPLSRIFAHLHLARPMQIDCIRMLNIPDASNQFILALYRYNHWHMDSTSAVIINMLPFAAFGFWFAYHNIDHGFENYALLALCSMFFAYASFMLMQLSLALSLRALSCGRLEALGSMDTIALRTYTSKMLLDTLDPFAGPTEHKGRMLFGFNRTAKASTASDTTDADLEKQVQPGLALV